MSRLAHLLTQLVSTPQPQTQDKLAATYFDPAPSAQSASTRSTRRWLGPLVVGMFVGLGVGLSLGGWWPARPLNQSDVPQLMPVLTFDTDAEWALLGERFGLWWGQPGDRRQTVALSRDSQVHAGSSGQSLRMDYALAPAGQGQANAPVGVWFNLPRMDSTAARPAQLEFMIRGDPARGSTQQQATLEMRNLALTQQQTLALGPQWTMVRVPLRTPADSGGQWTSWKEFRILLDEALVAPRRGRLYVDQIIVTSTPER